MKRVLKKSTFYLLLIVLLSFVLFPIYWMVVTAFKTNDMAFNIPPDFLFFKPTIKSFITQLSDSSGFLTFFLNSFIVASITTVLSVLIAVMAGYAFSRFKFPGKNSLFMVILTSQMFPYSLLVVGLYVFYRNIHLLDSYLGLILAFTSFTLPFAIWMMEGFLNSIPYSLDEAAEIDGASRLGTLWRVILPLTRPGMIAVGVFSFLNAWNNLLFALSLTSSEDMRTIAPGFLLKYVGQFQYFWADAMAGSVIIAIPMVVVFISLQKYLVQGMMAGAVKE